MMSYRDFLPIEIRRPAMTPYSIHAHPALQAQHLNFGFNRQDTYCRRKGRGGALINSFPRATKFQTTWPICPADRPTGSRMKPCCHFHQNCVELNILGVRVIIAVKFGSIPPAYSSGKRGNVKIIRFSRRITVTSFAAANLHPRPASNHHRK